MSGPMGDLPGVARLWLCIKAQKTERLPSAAVSSSHPGGLSVSDPRGTPWLLAPRCASLAASLPTMPFGPAYLAQLACGLGVGCLAIGLAARSGPCPSTTTRPGPLDPLQTLDDSARPNPQPIAPSQCQRAGDI